LRALQMALGLKEAPGGTPKDEKAQEAIGFHVSAETKETLAKQDLLKQDKLPANFP